MPALREPREAKRGLLVKVVLGKTPVGAAYSRAQAPQQASGRARDGSDLLRRAGCVSTPRTWAAAAGCLRAEL